MTYCTNDCTTCNHPSRREYAHDIICCPHKKPLFDLEDLLEEIRDMREERAAIEKANHYDW